MTRPSSGAARHLPPEGEGREAPSERAAALLALPSAQGRPDFAARAAACYTLHAHRAIVDGFMLEGVWPGQMRDFKPSSPEEDLAFAVELLHAAR